MRVVAYDPFVSKERFRELGVERADSQDDVLAQADFVTLHLPLTPETRGAVGAEAFSRMKLGERIVNAARGELLDEAALEEALRSGHVAGAALDVFSAEPYSGPLLELDNVVATPHIGYVSRDEYEIQFTDIFDQIVAYATGTPTNVVNPDVLAHPDVLGHRRT